MLRLEIRLNGETKEVLEPPDTELISWVRAVNGLLDHLKPEGRVGIDISQLIINIYIRSKPYAIS